MEGAEIFKRFKQLHPHNRESYNPSEDNVRRWQWHIDQKERAMLEAPAAPWEMKHENEMDEIRAKNAVVNFEDFPDATKQAYAEIASYFPSVQVVACGSRTRGDYVEAHMPDSFRQMRKEAGMAWKITSDFDFVAYTKDAPIEPLPQWADRMRYAPMQEQIIIPMWNFDLLPETEYENIKELMRKNKWKELAELHNRYNLSPHKYCCKMSPVKRYFKDAVDRGIIK